MADTVALTLANICTDVQIGICMCLQPSDILSLRKTCKAFQYCTRQRVVWEAALYHVCIDNALFLPSFPVPTMDDLELEKAAMAPTMWIEFCRRLDNKDRRAILRPPTTFFDNSIGTELPVRGCDFFLVPGGRYLVTYSTSVSPGRISVYDLRSPSRLDCRLIASVDLPMGAAYEGWTSFTIRVTPDGMGLTIFLSDIYYKCTIYEFYPLSKTPQISRIAHLDYNISTGPRVRIIPGTDAVIWCKFCMDMVAFWVWDYRLNHSISFTVHVELKDFDNLPEVIATKTAIIVLCEKRVLIWAIPDMLLQPPNFVDYDPWNSMASHAPPLLEMSYPGNVAPHFSGWSTTSPWYYSFLHMLYFDMWHEDATLLRLRIALDPDLNSSTLHLVNILEVNCDDPVHDVAKDCRVCEGSLFSCRLNNDYPSGRSWHHDSAPIHFFSASHSSPMAKVVFPDLSGWYHLLSCPATGRLIVLSDLDGRNKLVELKLYGC